MKRSISSCQDEVISSIFLEGLYGLKGNKNCCWPINKMKMARGKTSTEFDTHLFSVPGWTKAPASHFASRPCINLPFLCIPSYPAVLSKALFTTCPSKAHFNANPDVTAIDTAKPVVQSMVKGASKIAQAHGHKSVRMHYKRKCTSIGLSP